MPDVHPAAPALWRRRLAEQAVAAAPGAIPRHHRKASKSSQFRGVRSVKGISHLSKSDSLSASWVADIQGDRLASTWRIQTAAAAPGSPLLPMVLRSLTASCAA